MDGYEFPSFDTVDFTNAQSNSGVGVDFTPVVAQPEKVAISDDQAKVRAAKQDLALGFDSPGKDILAGNILAGKEDALRTNEASKQFIKDQEVRSSVVDAYIKSRPEGVKPSQEDIDLIRRLPVAKLPEIDTILEAKYAKNITGKVSDVLWKGAVLGEALQENRAAVLDHLNTFEQVLTNKELVQKKLEEVSAKIKARPYLNDVADVGGMLVPFLGNYRKTNLIAPAVSPYFPGSNLQDQYTQFYLSSPDRANAMLKLADTGLGDKNLLEYRSYLEGLISHTSTSSFLETAGMAVDALTIPGVARGTRALGNALGGATRALSGRSVRTSGVLDAMGDVDGATLASVIEKLDAKATSSGRSDTWEEIKRAVPSLFNVPSVSQGPSRSLTSNQVSRFDQELQERSRSLLKQIIDESLPIDRGLNDPAVMARAVDETRRLWNIQYPHMNNAVLDVIPSNTASKADRIANTEKITVVLGSREATAFETSEQATIAAKELYGFKDFTINQHGQGWVIQVDKSIDERSMAVFNQLAINTNHRTPQGLINTFAGYLRSQEDTVARELIKESKVAQYGSSQLTGIIRTAARDIGALPRRSREDITTFLERQQVMTNPNNPNVTGYNSRTVQDFERDWHGNFNRTPSAGETRAYFTYTQLHALDYVARNLNIYTAKHRLGLEMFDFGKAEQGLLGETKLIEGASSPLPTHQIEGKLVDHIHFDKSQSAGVLIWNRDIGAMEHTYTPFLSAQRVEELQNEGYKIVQLSRYGEEAVKNQVRRFNDERITYVLTKEANSRPLSLQQIPARDGWHNQYPDEGFFIRQPHIVTSQSKYHTSTYYGDRNVLHFSGDNAQASAELMNQRLETARQLYNTSLQNGSTGPSYTIYSDYVRNNLPYNRYDFERQFVANGGQLEPHLPFHVTRTNESVQQTSKISDLRHGNDLVYPNFHDAQNSIYDLYQGDVSLRFATERQQVLNTVDVSGSINNPVLQLRPSRLLDPNETLDRATNQLMRGRYIEDLKVKAMQDFVAEFHPLFEAPLEEIARNPFYYLTAAPFKNVAASDGAMLAAAKNTRRAALEMLGLKTEFEKTVSHVQQYLADTIGEQATNRITRVVDIVDPWMMGALTNPQQFTKNVAYNLKMGLFNPVQLFKQAQTFTHIMGVAGPIDATQAAFAAHMSRAMDLTLNPQMLKSLAAQATEWGWDRNHFIESYKGLQRSGFAHIGREQSVLGDFLNPQVIPSTGAKILDASTVFFKEGEGFVRNTAWHASYLNWRKANPQALFNEEAMKTVLERADLLNVNMSHASNAAWQNGPLSVPTQFFGYATRLTEQFLGNRLTGTEKARAIAMYSTMYGVPLGVLGTTTGAVGPIYEWYFQQLQKNGIDADKNVVLKTFNEGIPSVALEWLTGSKMDVKRGWGPNGNQFISDFIDNDKGFWGKVDLLGGAGVKTTRETVGAVAGLIGQSGQALLNVVKGTQDSLPLNPQDLVDVLENATTFDKAQKAWKAYHLAEYRTKNEATIVGDLSKFDALLIGTTGLQPTKVADYYGEISVLKNEKKLYQNAEKNAEQYFNLWMKETTPDLKAQYERRMKAELIGVPLDKQVTWLNQMTKKGARPLKEKLDFDFVKGNQDRFNAYVQDK